MTPYVDGIKAPTLLIWGDCDTATPLYMAEKLEKLIPDCGLCVIKGAGHWSFVERPGEVLPILKKFHPVTKNKVILFMQDTVMITAAAAVAALSSLPIITRQFQMLQQNSYFAVRYLRWYKGAFGVKTAARLIIALLSAAAVLLCTGKAATAALSAVMLLLCFFAVYSLRLDRRSVKPLVVTARVKRMYAAAGVLFAALFAVSVLTGGSCKKKYLRRQRSFGALPRTYNAFCAVYNEAGRKSDIEPLHP